MLRRPSRTLIGLAVPLVAIVLLLAAWSIDRSAGRATVVRNVELGDRDIGKFRQEKLSGVVQDLADDFADTKVRIETPKGDFESTAGDLGIEIDQAGTVDAALDIGRDDPLPAQPLLWLGSFASPRKAPVEYQVQSDVLELTLQRLQGEEAILPVEPAIVGSAEVVGVRAGTPGYPLDAEDIGKRLIEDAKKGEDHIRISVRPVERAPTVEPAQAQKLADELTAQTALGVVVRVRQKTGRIDPATVRSWLGSKAVEGELVPTIDVEKAKVDIVNKLGTLEGAPKNASFDVVNGAVKINPSVEGFRCCADDTGTRILEGIQSGSPEIEIPLIAAPAEFTTEEAQKLGIKEPIGTTVDWKGRPQVKSFTTYHDCCQPRVNNIHTMADAVRGTLIMPNEIFSLNDRVGERTVAKGYVPAGAIANGKHVEEVGGGVSQFSTTLYNAAFFAGLDLMSHQAHSEHFDRYPRGREATLGFPDPDNRIRNNSPYGMLIWTSYTDTSITVTFFSTQWAYGQQTGIVEEPAGECTRVTVTRTRYFPDGTTKTDPASALYRPREGVSCPG